MQVTPALPWTDETEGGVIQLGTPVSFDELIRGALLFNLSNNGSSEIAIISEGSAGLVIKERTNQQIIYSISAFEGNLQSIQINRMQGAPSGFALDSVQLNPITGNPALPWSEPVSGIISLPSAISFQNLKEFALNFWLKNMSNSEVFKAIQVNSTNNILIKISDSASSSAVYMINQFEGETTEIELRWNWGGTADYVLESVSFA